MKNIILLVCALTLVFAGAARAEVVEFSNGVVVDVPAGWSSGDDGKTITLLADDNSCAISMTIDDAGGVTAKNLAASLSKQHKGSEPEHVGNELYVYSFKSENGAESKVLVGVEEGKLKVISVTGEHEDVDDILDSVEEKE